MSASPHIPELKDGRVICLLALVRSKSTFRAVIEIAGVAAIGVCLFACLLELCVHAHQYVAVVGVDAYAVPFCAWFIVHGTFFHGRHRGDDAERDDKIAQMLFLPQLSFGRKEILLVYIVGPVLQTICAGMVLRALLASGVAGAPLLVVAAPVLAALEYALPFALLSPACLLWPPASPAERELLRRLLIGDAFNRESRDILVPGLLNFIDFGVVDNTSRRREKTE